MGKLRGWVSWAWALPLVLWLAGMGAAQAQTATGDPSVYINNQSNRTITTLRASLSTERNWGADRLGSKTLAAGQQFPLVLPRGACQYDLRVDFEGGGFEEKLRQDLCAVSNVSFDGRSASGGAAQPPAQGATGDPSIALLNRSRQTINEVYASLRSDSSWGADRLGSSVLPAGQRINLPLPRGDCRWDLRVVYDNNRAEEKRDQNLCTVSEVAFDGSGAVAIERDQAQGPSAPQGPRSERRGGSFGTGFFISAAGHMLTNHHVIEDCRDVRVHLETGPVPAVVLRHNQRNDLALLRVDAASGTTYARFRAQPSIRPGDGVVVAGFPLPNVLQNGLNITTGTVSAMAGMGGDIALMQITAPVQPGNSGGPLLDMSGHVVGVIVSKLNAQRIAEQTGDIPQNINFAVQGAVARLFLESGGTRYTEAVSETDLRAADVGERSRDFTRQIECR
jgi:S1-C subfamily serine protease